jgi:hypothetical protein
VSVSLGSLLFEVLTEVRIQTTPSCNVTQCSLIDITNMMKVLAAPSTLKIEGAHSSERFISIYQNTRCHFPEDCDMDQALLRVLENLNKNAIL